MKRTFFRYFTTLLLCAFALAADAAGVRLFHISRSLNRNIVCYDAVLKGGELDTKNPVHVYWQDNESHPGELSELNAIQRKLAFGCKVKSVTPTEAKVMLVAYSKRLVTITRRGGKWVALITINGKECVLTEVYVKTKSAVSVDYIELRGKATSNGAVTKEIIKA